jgi:hypothetical protein
MLVVLGIIIALAILGPLFGADSRDGRDWAPDHFWQSRDRAQDPEVFRSADSPEPPSAARAAVDHRRTSPAAC